jgi:hypothetical protein
MKAKRNPALSFALDVLAEMRQLDPRAATLEALGTRRRPDALIGLTEEGEFVPLLVLAAASVAYNVMSLFLWGEQGRFIPTGQRGTPEMLAKILIGPYRHLWLFDVLTKDFPSDQHDPSDQGDPSDQRSGT